MKQNKPQRVCFRTRSAICKNKFLQIALAPFANKKRKVKKDLNNISIEEMLDYSLRLWQKHKNEWSSIDDPKAARNMLLWLIAELGEVIDIVKKDGEEAIMKDKKVREKTIEEITDCFMYLAEILNRYKITPEEFSKMYHTKMQYNLKREYQRKYSRNI